MDELRSILIGTAGLTILAGIAAWLSRARLAVRSPTLVRGVRMAGGAALGAQAAHFAEELSTGFAVRLPSACGLAPWPTGFFVVFNVCWLAAWTASLIGLPRPSRPALFALWFLALAGIANGIAHPALALSSGGYFPGLATSPVVGVCGLLLVGRLVALTDGRKRGRAGEPDAACDTDRE